MRWIERLVEIFAPHTCLGCKAEGSLLCVPCAAALPVVPPRCYRCGRVSGGYHTCSACRRNSALFAVYPCTYYGEAAKPVVRSLKYERARAAARDIAAAIAVRGWPRGRVMISHVPTAPSRVRIRGYDQAALIARELATLTGAVYAPLLIRLTEGRQVGQRRLSRRLQMQGAFRPVQCLPAKTHVLLIDDVLTTGATCEAAARTLRRAGAQRVSAAVFAVA